MSHSYVSSLYHCVWSTKFRRKIITPELRDRLWPYLGGIARKNKMKALVIGGVEDHVHMLVSLRSTRDIAKAVQLIKGGSSKWVHETFPEQREFQWQEGYGACGILFAVRRLCVQLTRLRREGRCQRGALDSRDLI